MPRDLACGLALLLLAGCSPGTPRDLALVPLGDVRPDEVLDAARAALPQRFTVLNSVVFKKDGKSISVLGYTSVDEPGDTITVAVLSPAGVKLCEVSEIGGLANARYVAAPLAELGDVAGVVLRDVRRMYFDRLPAARAAWRRTGERLVFSRRLGYQQIEYVFAGAPVLPIRKTAYEEKERAWEVSYRDYEWRDEGAFARWMVLQDDKQGYELIVHLIEIVSVNGAEY